MNFINYTYASSADKAEWIDNLKINIGLNYFGGKTRIGRYIFNNIFNLAVQMNRDGKTADIFIDAFTGGGKMGLSVPENWFGTIVMNDLNYGVYSFYKMCKENPVALLMMIEKLSEVMSKDFFYMAAYLRSFGYNVDKWDEATADLVTKDETIDPLVAGAMTFWVTSAAYNGQTAPNSITYNFSRIEKDENGKTVKDNDGKSQENRVIERQEIEKTLKLAKKRIWEIHNKFISMNYIIENLDYRELIKKYNGKRYRDLQGNMHDAEPNLATKNKLWYMDPPYHPWCLWGGMDAPYANTFSIDMANEMVEILNGSKEDKYGQIEYFIKSDYDPEHALENAEDSLRLIKKGQLKVVKEQEKWFKKLLEMENNDHKVSAVFSSLESYPFCKICVGGFDKGALNLERKKTMGMEYIWCRGFEEGYEAIEGYEKY